MVFDAPTLNFYVDKLFPILAQTATALDIGANIGNHSIIFSNFFHRVIAFEPNPQVALLLRANTMGKSIEVIEKGLSDAQGKVNFNICDSNLGGSRIVDNVSDTYIDVVTLDQMIEQLNINNVSFIKIDVEGHELKVLAGAHKLLKYQQPVISLDLHSRELSEPINNLLMQSGYKHYYALVPIYSKHFYGIIPEWLLPKPLRPTVREVKLKSIHNLAECYGAVLIVSTEPLKL